ncbi:MAG: polysaccharide pyruvyl transferase family protein, partial [Sinobacteraceae bacterium]|nr:polysaccharide pyruvyl transferase family protein [Nevskiaceae bacterium]
MYPTVAAEGTDSFDAISRMLPLPEGRRAVLVSDSVHDQQTAELRRIAADLRATWAPMRRRMPVPLTRLRKLGAHRFVRRVARSACVLTGRFHAVTISIATGTPFFATTSNTPKIEAVLRDVFGNTNRIRRSAKQARAALESERVMFDEAELRAISAYLNQSQDGTRRMFDAIAGVA